MAKLLITKQMENQALLKSARAVHRRFELMRASMAIIFSYMTQADIKKTLGLKWSKIDFKGGFVDGWGNISPDAFALLYGVKEWKLEGSEYVFCDRFGEIISEDRFEDLRERIDEEAGLADLLKPTCFVVQ